MYQIYQIMYGDSLDSIAEKYNTTVDNLKEINRDISIVPGAYMIVPYSNVGDFTTYIVKNGDNLYGIANKYNTTVDMLASINGLKKNDYIYPNQKIMVPNNNVEIYITKENDTLSDISSNLNMSCDEIIKFNEKLYLAPEQLVVVKKERN